MRRAAVLVLTATVLAGACDRSGSSGATQAPRKTTASSSSRLLKPEDSGLLEDPDRDEWQQPDRIMDTLHIADGSRVADIGAGGGWFTIRLARRVGPNGVVYAEDIQPEMLASIDKRVKIEGLTNVQTVLGTPTDSHLTPGLQAVLLIDTYPQLSHPIELLRNAASALAPNGRVGIVDFKKDGAGGPGPPIDQRIDADAIVRDATKAGLKLIERDTFLRYQYLLVFGK